MNNNTDGIVPAEEMRQQTMENVELNIYNYFNEYKNFFIKRINNRLQMVTILSVTNQKIQNG